MESVPDTGTRVLSDLYPREDGGMFVVPGKGKRVAGAQSWKEVKGDTVGSRAWPCGSGSRQRGCREPPEHVE